MHAFSFTKYYIVFTVEAILAMVTIHNSSIPYPYRRGIYNRWY